MIAWRCASCGQEHVFPDPAAPDSEVVETRVLPVKGTIIGPPEIGLLAGWREDARELREVFIGLIAGGGSIVLGTFYAAWLLGLVAP